MNDDDLSLGDLGLADPETPLPRRDRPKLDMSPAAVAHRKRAASAREGASAPPTKPEGPPVILSTPPFKRVHIADLRDVVPPAPVYWWQGLLPAGQVALLNAHGSTGKSFIALQLACVLVLGRPLFGLATRPARVAYFSGEDPASVVRHRLHSICRAMDLDPGELDGRLHILDATDGDPTLHHEVAVAGGVRHGAPTIGYIALLDYLEEHDIDVLIVDNASDAFDANENDRSRVRGFMRALANLAQPDRAVLLLAHVDKGTSRGDRLNSTEGYSGSTAWHNSARSRMYLSRDKDGGLLLEHQKNNLGPLMPPIRLVWPKDGVPALDEPVNGFVQHIADGTDAKAVLKLLVAFYARGEWVATDTRSRYHAAKVLGAEPTYPQRRKPAEMFQLLRDAEHRGWIVKEGYQDKYRRPAERWQVTAAGREHAGIAASAASAASDHV